MTTAALTPTDAPRERDGLTLGERLLAVVRIHLASPSTTLVVPWLITLGIFALNMAIYGMVIYSAGGLDQLEDASFSNNGGVLWVFVFMLVMAVQAMHFTFRFSLGFSITRRDYYVGTLLYFLILAFVYSAGFLVLGAIERATNGWGLDVGFFNPLGVDDVSLGVIAYATFVGLLLFMAIGASAAALWVRWNAVGLYVYFGALAVAVVAFLWVVTVTHSWLSVGEFFATTPIWLLVTYLVPFTAIAMALGYAVIRRSPLRS